jgi:hypothetical protein
VRGPRHRSAGHSKGVGARRLALTARTRAGTTAIRGTQTFSVSGEWGPWGLSICGVYAVVVAPVAEE